MKKFLLLLCCFACIFSLMCFSACSNSSDENISDSTNNTENSTSENTDAVITIASDNTEVSPGEEFVISCTVKECKLFAAGDLAISFDKEKLTTEFVESTVESMYSFSNEIESGYQYSAYVASTVDMENTELFTLYCTLSEDCKSGDEIEIKLICDEWLVGTDKTGDEVKSIADEITTNSLLIKVR